VLAGSGSGDDLFRGAPVRACPGGRARRVASCEGAGSRGQGRAGGRGRSEAPRGHARGARAVRRVAARGPGEAWHCHGGRHNRKLDWQARAGRSDEGRQQWERAVGLIDFNRSDLHVRDVSKIVLVRHYGTAVGFTSHVGFRRACSRVWAHLGRANRSTWPLSSADRVWPGQGRLRLI